MDEGEGESSADPSLSASEGNATTQQQMTKPEIHNQELGREEEERGKERKRKRRRGGVRTRQRKEKGEGGKDGGGPIYKLSKDLDSLKITQNFTPSQTR